MKITLFIPCFIDLAHPRAGLAVVEILERLGHTVTFAESLTCCGQPAFNSGYWDQARPIAEKVLHELRDAGTVVIPSGSCGAMLKVFYSDLFKNTPLEAAALDLRSRVFEFSDFLVSQLGVTDLGARFPARATFHDGCHGLRELGIRTQPRALLQHVRGLELVEMEASDTCCGFGGTFAAKFPAISTAMGENKCANALATRADVLISNDSSCLLQIDGLLRRTGKPLRTLHLAEVLNSR